MSTDNIKGGVAACRKDASPLPSWPRRLGVLFFVVAGTVAAVATGSAAGGPAARTSYQVIQLSPDLGATGFINNRDQVVFTETRDGVFRPRLYDAGQVRELARWAGPTPMRWASTTTGRSWARRSSVQATPPPTPSGGPGAPA